VAVNRVLVVSLVCGLEAALGQLLLGATYMAYRVSELVGHFRAWIFIMIAVLLIASSQFISLGSLVFMSQAEIESALSKDNLVALMLTGGLGLSIGSLFFIGMFEMRRIFTERLIAQRELRDLGVTTEP
jgi:hypothetical protein